MSQKMVLSSDLATDYKDLRNFDCGKSTTVHGLSRQAGIES
jgi:hypothetical protein